MHKKGAARCVERVALHQARGELMKQRIDFAAQHGPSAGALPPAGDEADGELAGSALGAQPALGHPAGLIAGQAVQVERGVELAPGIGAGAG